jgi:hypothetical protein
MVLVRQASLEAGEPGLGVPAQPFEAVVPASPQVWVVEESQAWEEAPGHVQGVRAVPARSLACEAPGAVPQGVRQVLVWAWA